MYEYKSSDNGWNNFMKDQYLQKKYINKKFKQRNESFQEIGSESVKKN